VAERWDVFYVRCFREFQDFCGLGHDRDSVLRSRVRGFRGFRAVRVWGFGFVPWRCYAFNLSCVGICYGLPECKGFGHD